MNHQKMNALSETGMDFPATHVAPTFALHELRTIEHTGGLDTKVERVSSVALEALQSEDSRIDVIHVAEPTRESLEQAIAARLDHDFMGESSIGIRAIQASIDGMVTGWAVDVHDVRDILPQGDMLGRDLVNLAPFQPAQGADAHSRLNYHVVDFAAETGLFRRMALGDSEDSGRVFPVLLVYDQSKMQRRSLYGYELSEQRATMIRKAYVLDAVIASDS